MTGEEPGYQGGTPAPDGPVRRRKACSGWPCYFATLTLALEVYFEPAPTPEIVAGPAAWPGGIAAWNETVPDGLAIALPREAEPIENATLSPFR
jgi:phage tail protein X